MNYGLVITEKDIAFVGKGIPPQVAGYNNGKQFLPSNTYALAVDVFANSLETIWGQKSLQIPRYRRRQCRVLKNESLSMRLIRKKAAPFQ